jgi:D-amino peptidase
VKIFISSDFEGTAGVVDWDQVRDGGARYEYFTDLLTGEINAAIEGAQDSGAMEFLVNDSHGRMSNLRPGDLAGGASYLSGRYKPMYMMEGLDSSFDAVFFVSYHGSMGAVATLSHTYFPMSFAEVSINGIVVGESGINALVALAYDVPIVLITGDQATADEMTAVCPSVRAAVVKSSITRFAAESLHPERARALIRESARDATSAVPHGTNVTLRAPLEMKVRFQTTDYCELATRITGCERTSDLEGTIRSDDPLAAYRTFITTVLLCRGLAE